MATSVPSNVKMIFGINEYQDNILSIINNLNLFNKHDKYWYFPNLNSDEVHLDPTKAMSNAGTASLYALMFAIYMGFEKIYLVGCDHNYICIKDQKDYRFYSKALHQAQEEERINKQYQTSENTREFIGQSNIFIKYEKLRKYATKTKIFNVSPDSLLDIFEYQEYNSCFT